MVRIRKLKFGDAVYEPVLMNGGTKPAAAPYNVVNFNGLLICAARPSGTVAFFSPEKLFTSSSAALDAAKALV